MKNAEHITWAMKKCSAEHVSIAAFAIAFDYYDRQTAELNYRTLINNPELSQARRRRLLANLTTFNVNRANGFWAKRATIAQADVFAMKAAAVSMEVGLHQSKVICQKYLPPHGADTPDEDEAQHGTETEAESVEEDENGEEEAEAEAEEEEDGDEDENEDEVEDEDEDGNENEDEGTYFSYQEMSNLQANIAQAQHPECTWKSGDECIACQFQHYQKECLQALQDRLLKKSEIADVMAILGVFAPFLPSERMRECFGLSVLRDLAQSPELPEPNIDDSAVIRAVRLRINLKREEASETLRPLERTARMLFENLLETLPEQPDRSIAEFTFTANCVAPVLNGILNTAGETEVQYPNRDSSVQKSEGLKPDRPDIIVKAYGKEILYGEVTGPCMAKCLAKTNWDLFRLSRFGKAYLDTGNRSVPLLQIVHETGLAMNLSCRVRGIYLLEKVGCFTIPCSISAVPTLLATLPVLLRIKTVLMDLSGKAFKKNRKRSWKFDEIVNAKKRTL